MSEVKPVEPVLEFKTQEARIGEVSAEKPRVVTTEATVHLVEIPMAHVCFYRILNVYDLISKIALAPQTVEGKYEQLAEQLEQHVREIEPACRHVIEKRRLEEIVTSTKEVVDLLRHRIRIDELQRIAYDIKKRIMGALSPY